MTDFMVTSRPSHPYTISSIAAMSSTTGLPRSHHHATRNVAKAALDHGLIERDASGLRAGTHQRDVPIHKHLSFRFCQPPESRQTGMQEWSRTSLSAGISSTSS